MWQRKQTIYLFLVAFLMVIAAVVTTDWGHFAFAVVLALLGAGTIFPFKNRKLQMKLCTTGCILVLLWMVYFAVDIYYITWNQPQEAYFTGAPLLSYLFFRLAKAGVKHDEDLVRSADRIR